MIPAYNEESHIIDSIKKVDVQITQVTNSYEIILIDDGSTDQTWKKLTEAIKLFPHLQIIKLSRNFGKEYALCAGVEQAKGKAVIIMDADMQHPPSLIPKMVSIWRNQDIGIVECIKRERDNERFRNRLGGDLFYKILKSLTGYHLKGASDFKLLDEKVVQALIKMPERNTFFRGMTAWLGFEKVSLEFDVDERVKGETKWSFIGLAKLALNAVVSFTALPLRFVSLTGLLFMAVAFILGIQTLYLKVIGTAVTGFTTVILLLLIIGSVVMVSLGIIGEYISAIYQEVKGRPRYIIEENYSSDSQISKVHLDHKDNAVSV